MASNPVQMEVAVNQVLLIPSLFLSLSLSLSLSHCLSPKLSLSLSHTHTHTYRHTQTQTERSGASFCLPLFPSLSLSLSIPHTHTQTERYTHACPIPLSSELGHNQTVMLGFQSWLWQFAGGSKFSFPLIARQRTPTGSYRPLARVASGQAVHPFHSCRCALFCLAFWFSIPH